MEYRFEISERALADADRIFDRIAARSMTQATNWYQVLFREFETLTTFPSRCPVAPESVAYGHEVREGLYGKRPSVYRISFLIRDDLVFILAVWHASHGPARL